MQLARWPTSMGALNTDGSAAAQLLTAAGDLIEALVLGWVDSLGHSAAPVDAMRATRSSSSRACARAPLVPWARSRAITAS